MSRGFWELLLLLFNSAVRPAETGERSCRGDFPDESLEWGDYKSMSEDWVSGYIKENDQEREVELRKARFVAAGSLGLFKQLWDRVKEDLDSFHASSGDSQLKGQFMSASTFVVRCLE